MNAKLPAFPVKPRVSHYFYVLPIADDRILFKTAGKVVSIRGKTVTTLLPKLLPLLTGQHTVAEIIAALPEFGAESIRRTLELMNNKELLEDAAIEPPLELSQAGLYVDQLAFFSHFTRNNFEAQLALQNAHVAVIGLNAIGSTVLNALAFSGIGQVVGVDEARVQRRDCGGATIYSLDDIGRLRCDVVQERMKGFPDVHFQSSFQPIRPPATSNKLSKAVGWSSFALKTRRAYCFDG